jgi:hypothetical protein
MAALALVALAVSAPSLLSGCDGRGPLEVRKVLVDVEPAATGVDREQIRDVVDKTLQKTRGVRLVDAGKGDAAVLRVRVEGYGPPGEQAGPQRTTLALTVEVTGVPGDAAPGGFRGHAVASGAGLVDARTLVDSALRDALAQVLMTRGASDLGSPQLISWLKDDDASDDQKRRAIRILGSRRERSAVEPLAAVLTSGDEELAPLALAALTNIGDPGAVDAVIAYSDKQPPVVVKQCIEAVRSMGSPRGRAWLFTLSTGHPDPDVEQQAAAALAVLEKDTASSGGAAIADTSRVPAGDSAVR